MMRRNLHRIAPTLLALGLLPAAAFGAASSAERDAHWEAVKSLIENEYRLPAQRQLADFLKAGYPESSWYGKHLTWFFDTRFAPLVTDKAQSAQLAAEAKTLQTELDAAAASKQLPKNLQAELSGGGKIIRLVNDLARVVGQDQSPDRTMPIERRTAINAVAAALAAETTAFFAEGSATIKARAKFEEDLWNLDDKDPKFQKGAQESVELRLEIVRPVYFAHKMLREIAERGEDFGLDPKPVRAFLEAFSKAHVKTLQDWDYNWGDYQPYLRAFAVDVAAQAARFKTKGVSIDDFASDYMKLIDIDVAKEYGRDPAVAEEIRTLQAKDWGSLIAFYRELGKDVAPKYYQAGLDVFQNFKDRTKTDKHFRLDHANTERGAEVARIYFQAARLQLAKGDPAAAGTFGQVAAVRANRLAGNAAVWANALGGAKMATAGGGWGAQPVAEDPTVAIGTAAGLARQANSSANPVEQRNAQLAAAVSLRNGVLGLGSVSFAETADASAPELWFRYAETLSKLGLRWHAALVAQSGLRHLAARTAELKKNPWQDKAGKWTKEGRYISPLARNAITYASALLAAGKGTAISQIYDETITLVNTVSPADGGKSLERIQIVIAFQEKDWKRANELIDTYVKKYPEEQFDGASLRSVVAMGSYDVAPKMDRKVIADKAIADAEAVAKLADAELTKSPEAARKRVLLSAKRDVQGLIAFFALREGQETKVLEMLGPDYWKAPPDDEKSVQMLGYLCQALRQWYEAQAKDATKGVDAKLLVANWPKVQAVYEIWKTQKDRLPTFEERITKQGVQIAWVFNVISTRQVPVMRTQPHAPGELGDISKGASRAFADLIEPILTASSETNNLLAVGNVLWDLDEHTRAARLYVLFLAKISADPEVAALRDSPKDSLAAIDAPITARPELRAKWTEVKDLLIDDPNLSQKIIEQDLSEDTYGERKRDYVKAIEAVRALRAEAAKAKMSLGADFAKIDEALTKLDGQIAQLGRMMSVTAKLALTYREEGKTDEANKLYDVLIAYDPTNPDFLAATVELVIKQLKDGVAVPAEVIEKTRIKAARVRESAQYGTPTYWTAAIQVLELSLFMKDVDMVNKSLRFAAVNQSTPADDLQMLPRNRRDDKRVRRARNALSVDLCKRYLAIFTQPGITTKPSFAISEVEIDGKTTPVFTTVDGPKYIAVSRELEDGSTVIFLWEDGKTPPAEPETAQTPAAAAAPSAPATPGATPAPEAKP